MIEQHVQLDRGGQLRLEDRDEGLDRIDDGDGVGVGLALHGEQNAARAVVPARLAVVLDAVDRLGDVLQSHRRAVAIGDDQILVLRGVGKLTVGLKGEGLLRPHQRADRSRGIGGGDGALQIVERHALGGERLGIGLDADGEFLLPEDQHLADAAQRRKPLRDQGLGIFIDLRQR